MTEKKGKGSPYSITERRVPELIPVPGSQPAGGVSHEPGGRLPLLSASPAVPPRVEGCYQFCCLVNRGTMGVNSLPKTVTRQSCDCDLNPDPSAPESSTLTTRLPSHSGRERNDIDMYSVMQTFQPTDPCPTCRRVLLLLLLLFIRIKRRGSSPAIEYGLYLYLLYAWVVNFWALGLQL